MSSRNGDSEPLAEEVRSFFESAPPLKNREIISQKLKDFVDRNSYPSGINSSNFAFIFKF